MNLLQLSVLGLLLLLQPTCQRDKDFGKEALLNTDWTLVSINETELDSGLKAPTLFFEESGNKINGFAGCNQFFGSYRLAKDSLSFSGLGSTKMFCENSMKLEQQYLDLLGKTENFVVSEGDSTLTLLSNAIPVLVFSQEGGRESSSEE